MSDPRRLVEQDELARLLLGSASEDGPSADGRARARRAALSAAAIGLGAGASIGLVAGGAKAAGKFSTSVLLKVLALASVPAAVVAGIVITQLSSAPPPLQAAMSVSLPPSAMAPALRVVEKAPTPADVAPETPPDLRPSSPRKAEPVTSVRVVAPSLQAEITKLDAARHALARGDASVLDSYLAEYPRGALREQALWMKISNLEQTGRKAQASALAKRLIASYPNGAYAARARALALP